MLAQLFSEKSVLIIVTVVGMAMCTAGIGQVAARGEWLQPMAILAYVMGALILVIVGATVFDIRLPLIDSTRTALIVVVLLAALKFAVTQIHHMLA